MADKSLYEIIDCKTLIARFGQMCSPSKNTSDWYLIGPVLTGRIAHIATGRKHLLKDALERIKKDDTK